MSNVLDSFEIVLAFLYACKNSNMVARVHVWKGLFIASQYSKMIAESLKNVDDAVEKLKRCKLIEIDEHDFIRLSEEEMRIAEKAWRELPGDVRRVLSDVADFVSKLDKDELLLYTYVVFGSWEKSDVIDKAVEMVSVANENELKAIQEATSNLLKNLSRL